MIRDTLEEVPAQIPTPGSLFAGRYRVDSVLGTGGMGVVLAVTDEKTNVACALKLVSAPELAEDRARLVREARALMLISSPHVVRVFDVDEVEGVGPYLVLEKLEGKDLGAFSPVNTRMPWADVAFYTRQACDALAAAHAVGIIHRDIKPSNLFLANTPAGPVVKVLDFGISKVGPGDGLGSLTNPDGPLGSPQFISPEQITAPRGVDERTDVWALGAVMYRLLTGKFPFNGPTVSETFALVLRGDRIPVATLAPDAPAGIHEVIERCLERDVKKRFATVKELADALLAFAPQELPTIRQAVELPSRALDSSESTTVPRRASSKSAIALVALGMAVPLAIVLVLRLRDRPVVAEPFDPSLFPSAAPVVSAAPSTITISVTAFDRIDTITAPGLRRIDLDGNTASLTVIPWTNVLPVRAKLANGSDARGEVKEGDTTVTLQVGNPTPPPASVPPPRGTRHHPASGPKKDPEPAPSATSELRPSPYQ